MCRKQLVARVLSNDLVTSLTFAIFRYLRAYLKAVTHGLCIHARIRSDDDRTIRSRHWPSFSFPHLPHSAFKSLHCCRCERNTPFLPGIAIASYNCDVIIAPFGVRNGRFPNLPYTRRRLVVPNLRWLCADVAPVGTIRRKIFYSRNCR